MFIGISYLKSNKKCARFIHLFENNTNFILHSFNYIVFTYLMRIFFFSAYFHVLLFSAMKICQITFSNKTILINSRVLQLSSV